MTTRNWSRGRVNFRRVPSGNASTFAATCYRPGIINFPLLGLSLSLSFFPFLVCFHYLRRVNEIYGLPLHCFLEFCDSVELVESSLYFPRKHIFPKH